MTTAMDTSDQSKEDFAGEHGDPLGVRNDETLDEHRLARRIFIGYKLDDCYFRPNESAEAISYAELHVRHVMKDWFPGAVCHDLTAETARLDVVIKKGHLSGRSVYETSYFRADGSLIKKATYDEDRLVGRVCPHYDKTAVESVAKVCGADIHSVVFSQAYCITKFGGVDKTPADCPLRAETS
jgi:hypothetical protein